MTAVAGADKQQSVWGSRIGVAVIVLVLGVIALLFFVNTQRSTEVGELDPDAPVPQGSRALAVLLKERGTAIREIDRTDQLSGAVEEAGTGNTTVLVTAPYNLTRQRLKELAALPATDRVVLVAPDAVSLDALGIGAQRRPGGGPTEAIEPGCDLPEAVSAGNAVIGTRYAVEEDAAGVAPVICYRGGLVLIDRPGQAQLVLLGGGSPMTNDVLAEHGHAALMLGLLNEHPRLLWLTVPIPEPVAEEERPGLFDLLPGWIPAAILLTLVAGVMAALWRARRLGPPVTEPLPVIVRSAETVEGRARLYARARARPDAIAALRATTLARITPVLGLGRAPEPAVLVPALAERSGWPVDRIGTLLFGAPPADDRALVEAANALDALTAAVLTPSPSGPETSDPTPSGPETGDPAPTTRTEPAADNAPAPPAYPDPLGAEPTTVGSGPDDEGRPT